MTDKEKIISFETAKLAKEKGYFPAMIKLEKLGFPMYKFGLGSYNAEGEYALRNYYNQSNPHYLAPDLLELHDWLRRKHNILVVVDYDYECTEKSYCYKIYKFVDEHGKPERWPVKGVYYDKDGKETERTVAWCSFKRSYKEYQTYTEAFDAGLQEGLSMIEVKEKNAGDVTIRENGLYIENNEGTININ